MRALVIAPDGMAQVVEQDWSSEQIQEAVGGLMESVHPLPWPDTTLYVNEEGRLNDLPPNPAATALLDGIPEWVGQPPLLGTVVLIGRDGDAEADLPDATLEAILSESTELVRMIGEARGRVLGTLLGMKMTDVQNGNYRYSARAALEWVEYRLSNPQEFYANVHSETDAAAAVAAEMALGTVWLMAKGNVKFTAFDPSTIFRPTGGTDSQGG